MPYLSGIDRNQIFMFSFNDYVPQDSPVRLIDAFVSHLDLNKLEYITYVPSSRGQQPYDRADLIKLHIYGYMNGIRSSRKLATEASRNIELMWLVNNTCPGKSCISDFVKNNKRPLKNTFKQFIDFLKFSDFIDAKAVCIDGTKIRSQNSRNKYYSTKKIDATISYFNGQMDKYLHDLKSTESSVDVDPNAVMKLKNKINDYQAKLDEYYSVKKDMEDKDLSQVTLTDPDSRMMTSHGNSDISYNLQTSVDTKNSLIVACDVVSDINDTNQLENMVSKKCPYRKKCTSSSSGRTITRNFYQDTLDVVQQRFEENPEMYTLRKSTVEHPFGTIKRSLGYTYFLRKGLASVNTEAALICLAYNFKRLVNISKFEDIIKKMEEYFSSFYTFFSNFILYNKKLINFY